MKFLIFFAACVFTLFLVSRFESFEESEPSAGV